MFINEINIPIPFGTIAVQIFGDSTQHKPMVALSGYRDNSNSFKPIAPYLCKNGYYIVSIDYPGHGFSSPLPDGIQYTPSNILNCVRMALRYLNVKNFIFLTHSFGSLLSVMYTLAFPNEVESIISIDLMGPWYAVSKTPDISKFWNQNLDELIDFEYKKKDKPTEYKGELTKELAVKILLKANKSLDENSAKIILERGLKLKNGKLEFSRDEKSKYPSENADFSNAVRLLETNFNYPFLLIYAYPYYAGENEYKMQSDIVKYIKENNKNKVEFIKFDGTHHFHMIEPEKTSEIILRFLNDIKPKNVKPKL